MAKKKPVKGKEKATAVAAKPDDRKGVLKAIGGSHSDCLNTMLANQAMQALWLEQSDSTGNETPPLTRWSGSVRKTSWRA